MTDKTPIRRALISVSDKTGLIELGQSLARLEVEILSTGGTARALAEAGIPVKEVADHTGFPEMMDGRVKTLHPKIHGGLLGLRDKPDHRQAMKDHDIGGIDLLIINLYPFEQTVARGADFGECIENIDIGGPAMIRSAAKNHAWVTLVTDPADYALLERCLADNDGCTTLALRRDLAARAFARTASYDTAISTWFSNQQNDPFPQRVSLTFTHQQSLRYGENPHQNAAFYRDPAYGGVCLADATQVQGKELSYNNINDTDAAFDLVSDLDADRPAVAIIKHANPCGVAQADELKTAYEKALMCDPVSAFGGIVALNRPLDGPTATEIARIFTEVIIAPGADDAAREILAKKKNLRLLLTEGLADTRNAMRTFRPVRGGLLIQDADSHRVTADDLKVVTRKIPSDAQIADLLLAFTVAKHVKSNAIVYVRDGMTVGVGAGQMNRKDSARIAAIRGAEAAEAAGLSEPLTKGSVVASDAFFPFADGLLEAADAGVTAVIQPGGSIRDEEVIAAADDAGIAMVFTGVRHFRH